MWLTSIHFAPLACSAAMARHPFYLQPRPASATILVRFIGPVGQLLHGQQELILLRNFLRHHASDVSSLLSLLCTMFNAVAIQVGRCCFPDVHKAAKDTATRLKWLYLHLLVSFFVLLVVLILWFFTVAAFMQTNVCDYRCCCSMTCIATWSLAVQ